MSNVEKLNFKIGLSGTYWDKKPKYSVAIDDSVQKTGVVDCASEEVFFVEFAADITEAQHSLKIRLENKDNSDVQKDDYNSTEFTIIYDMLLNIVSIEIDEIDISNLLHSHSTFTGDEANRPVLKNCVNLGWNGTWEIAFTSPFYLWLLENI